MRRGARGGRDSLLDFAAAESAVSFIRLFGGA
jgi:hypothetical protein